VIRAGAEMAAGTKMYASTSLLVMFEVDEKSANGLKADLIK
jgi:hypothetical protein